MEEKPKRLGGVTGKGFLPGTTGNPGGRPKSLAAAIRKQTKEGRILWEFMLSVAVGDTINGRKPRLCDRIEAVKWLADRGWGRSVQSLQHSGIGADHLEAEVVFYIPHNTRDQDATSLALTHGETVDTNMDYGEREDGTQSR